MLAVLNVSAFAEVGYGENSGDASDKIAEPIARNYCPEYAAAYNDFENIVSYSGGSGFVIEETAYTAHKRRYDVCTDDKPQDEEEYQLGHTID